MNDEKQGKFLHWSGTPSLLSRYFYVQDDIIVAEIQEYSSFRYKWCWWGGNWKKTPTLRSACNAVIQMSKSLSKEAAK